MNPKKEGRRPELDLELNLSPPRTTASPPPQSPPLIGSSSLLSMKPSPPSSCVSWELGQGDDGGDSSPLAAAAAAGQMMVVVGCPRCMMYVMLAEEDCPKCPVCKSTVLLDFFHDERVNTSHK